MDFVLNAHEGNWGPTLYDTVRDRYASVFSPFGDELKTLILLGISKVEVCSPLVCYMQSSKFQVNSALPISKRYTLEQAERASLVFLSPHPSGAVCVSLPFVLLRVMNNLLSQMRREVFPPDFLFSPTSNREWQWQNFELLLPYFYRLLLLAFSATPELPARATLLDVLRGSTSSTSTTLQTRRITLPTTSFDVFKEKYKYVHLPCPFLTIGALKRSLT